MKCKLFLVSILFISMAANAQSPFKAEPKYLGPASPTAPTKMRYALVAPNTFSASDSILNAWRFAVAVSPVGFTFGGTYQASAGVEYGLQHQDYNFASQTYTVLYSINAVWVPITTGQPIRSLKDVATFGALYGIKNNLIQAGPFYNPNAVATKDRFGIWVVLGINLN